ncbi:hypothetical protein [Paraglaciecola sp.]
MRSPLASAKRCVALPKSLRKAVKSYPENRRGVILGTGSLSH